MIHHIFLVLAVLWLLSSHGWCHPFAYFASFFYLYLVNERHALRLWKKLQHEERLNAYESKMFVDFESVRWLNNAIAKVWPIFMEQIASQQILLPMIPWFLDKYKPWTAREAALQHLYLGKKPPEINKIRVLTQSANREHLVLELGMSFLTGDDMSAIFTVKLRKRLGLGLRAKMHVTNMHIEGKVSVGVKFLQKWPYLGHVTMSFVEPPHFQMTVKPIFHHGLDVTELPGIAGWLDRIFSVAFQQTLVQPNMLVLDVEKLVFNKKDWFTVHGKIPVAFAEVEILEGIDMKSSDLSGSTDPYVKGRLGRYKIRTKVQRKTSFPKWFEEYMIPIISWSEPNMLILKVHHKDLLSVDRIGSCKADISKLRGGQKHDIWLPLENAGTAQLHLSIRILEAESPTADDVNWDTMMEETTETAASPGAKGEGEDLKSAKLFKFEHGNVEDRRKTTQVHHAANNETCNSSNTSLATTNQCSSTDSDDEKHGKLRSAAKLKKGLKSVRAALHRSSKDRSSA